MVSSTAPFMTDVRTRLTNSSAFIWRFVPIWLTSLAISGEAHRDGQGCHGGGTFVMYTGSELSVAGFGRFIVGLASVHAAFTLIVNLRPAALS